MSKSCSPNAVWRWITRRSEGSHATAARMGITAPSAWILFRDLILLLAASSSEFFKLLKRRGIRARLRTLPRCCGRSRAIPIEAKVHRQNSKRRESPRMAAESLKWAFLRWPLNSRSAAHAAISCTSSEISIHRGLGCGGQSFRTLRRLCQRSATFQISSAGCEVVPAGLKVTDSPSPCPHPPLLRGRRRRRQRLATIRPVGPGKNIRCTS